MEAPEGLNGKFKGRDARLPFHSSQLFCGGRKADEKVSEIDFVGTGSGLEVLRDVVQATSSDLKVPGLSEHRDVFGDQRGIHFKEAGEVVDAHGAVGVDCGKDAPAVWAANGRE